MNGFSVRVFGFIFLVCKVEGAVIDARDHNTKIWYVFEQSKSTDINQMSYTPTRIQDLQTLDLPTVGSTGIKIYDAMRIYTGDNIARQFECGQQRAGTTVAFVESM
jgi:hypothetical protein